MPHRNSPGAVECGLLDISFAGVAALADVGPTDRLKSKLHKSSCIVPTVALGRASSLDQGPLSS
jgi:hypothetical protein